MTRSLIAVALVLALAPACDDDDDDIIVVDPVGDTQDEGFARGSVLADQAAGELTGDDFLIVIGKTATILATLNDNEIAQSDFAAPLLDDDDVFNFANVLIADHDEANLVLDDVVRFYGINYIPSTSANSLAAEGDAGIALLRATDPDDIDFEFSALQVINHAEALVLLDELALQVGPGAMGDYIADTRVMIEDHLDLASDLMGDFVF